jgi:hypothetical protein
VSESDSIISQVLVRFAGGASAIIIGTWVGYRLVIGNYLERLERYKERLKVHKKLYGLSRKVVEEIEGLESVPESLEHLSKIMEKFNSYSKGENDLFMSMNIQNQCRQILSAQETLMEAIDPGQYPESEAPQYPQENVSNLIGEFRSLNDIIKSETTSIGFQVPKWFFQWYKGLVPRLPVWCHQLWICMRSNKD